VLYKMVYFKLFGSHRSTCHGIEDQPTCSTIDTS